MTGTLRRSIGNYLLAALYAVLLIPATLGAYAGALWVGVSDRGWQTQSAAAALMVGWLLLIVAGVTGWKALSVKSRAATTLTLVLILLAVASYAVVSAWGGRMLI